MGLLLHRASAVLTLAGDFGPRRGAAMSDLRIIENGSVAITDEGTIAWVGPADDVPGSLRRSSVVDCSGDTLMPAFVDPHTHLVWGGDRKDEMEQRLGGADYEEIFAAGGGILSSVRQTRELSEDELYLQALARIARMRRAGTTTFEIKSGYGLDLDAELKQLRVVRRLRDEGGFRVTATCLAAHAIPEESRGSDADRAAFISRVVEEILPAVVNEGLADSCDVFCDRGAFTPEESRRVLEKGLELGLELRVHANEFGHTGGALLAAELGAASADHLLALNAEERAALRDADVVATLLPGTSLVLGKPFADGRALVEDGVAVAIASDCNPGSCALESIAVVLGLACYGNRLSPAEAICAATHNAAASMGLDDQVGSLKAGRQADIIRLATSDYRDLVYHAGSPLIHSVYQAGTRIHGAHS